MGCENKILDDYVTCSSGGVYKGGIQVSECD
jgi:hypothetical protein